MKMDRMLPAIVVSVCLVSGVLCAADWPQWMGPQRSNVAPESPELVDSFAEGKPRVLWTSEEVIGGWKGGWGTVAVRDGKAYVFSSFNYKVPFPQRKLEKKALEGLGWTKDFPEDLAKKVEDVRKGDALNKIRDRKKKESWINNWMKENVPDDLKRFRGAVQRRLRGGAKWLSDEQLRKLETIIDKEFPNQGALDAWYTENGFDKNARQRTKRVIPTANPAARDFILCLDAATGKALWKTELPATHMSYPGSSTPLLEDGTVYLLSSDGFICAVDVEKGELKWKTECPRRNNWHRTRCSSPVVADGAVIVLTEAGTIAVDAKTGAKRWEERGISNEGSSPTPVTMGGKTWLLVNGSKKLSLVDPATGKSPWFVRGGGEGSAVVAGDIVVLNAGQAGGGLRAWKLAGDKEPEELWQVPLSDDYTTPVVYKDHVYAIGKQGKKWKMVCVTLADGKVAWEQEMPKDAEYSMPIVADGKILAVVGKELYLIKATPEKYVELGKADLGLERWTSATIADGKVYLRRAKAIICCDVTCESRPRGEE